MFVHCLGVSVSFEDRLELFKDLLKGVLKVAGFLLSSPLPSDGVR